jgi:TPR repeat protein
MMMAYYRSSLGVLGFLLLGAAVLVSHHHSAIAQSSEDPGEITASQDDVYVKLVSKKYPELERQFAGYLELYAAGKISEYELASRFAIFNRSDGLEARFDEWVSAYPKSYSARLARGIYRISDAWRKRGSKLASQTTDMQFHEFTELLKKAASDVQASIGLHSRPVASYRYLIQISKGLGLGAERGFLDEALKLDANAYYPRHAYLEAITPKWGGSERLMQAFLEECKRSPMSNENKIRIELDYRAFMAQQASWDKQYMSASEHYLSAYQLRNDAKWLYWSAKTALDGGFTELAFSQFDELVKAHPKYEWGYTRRGFLYENHFKNDEKAFKDYLQAAELGNSWAQNRVGWWYMTGKYAPLDYDKAEFYLRRAAAQNNRTAIANLKNLDKLRKGANARK